MTILRTVPVLVVVAVLTGACGAFEVASDHDAPHGAMHDGARHDTHGSDDHGSHDDTPPVDGAPRVDLAATSMTFSPASLELTAGEPVNIALSSDDILHDLVVADVGFHLAADVGDTVVGGLQIDVPGTYVGYCSVPGHRAAGMELQLTVDGAAGA